MVISLLVNVSVMVMYVIILMMYSSLCLVDILEILMVVVFQTQI